MKVLYLLILPFIIFSSITSYSQDFWKQTNGPWGAPINSIIEIPNGLLCATDKGIFKSDDGGEKWGLFCLDSLRILSLFRATDGTVYAAGPTGVYSSADNGATWENISYTLMDMNVTDVASRDSLFALGRLDQEERALFRYAGDPLYWVKMENDINIVECIALPDDNVVILGTNQDGIYRSTNNGTDFVKTGLNDYTVNCLYIDFYGNVLAGTENNGIFKSEDNGQSWQLIGFTGHSVQAIVVKNNGYIFAGTADDAIYRSVDQGQSWTKRSIGIQNNQILSFAYELGGAIFAGTDGDLYISNDDGISWEESSHGIINFASESFAFLDNTIFCSNSTNGVYSSTDNGYRWIKKVKNLPIDVISIASASDGNLYAGSRSKGVFRSGNAGGDWGPVYETDLSKAIGTVKTNSDDEIFISVYDEGIFQSTNQGLNWNNIGPNDAREITAIEFNNMGYIFAGTADQGMYRTTDKGTNWENLPYPSINVNIINISSTQHIYVGDKSGKVYHSSNNGDNWTEIADFGVEISGITSSNTNIIVSNIETGVSISNDQGNSWEEYNSGLDNLFAHSLAKNANGDMYVGTKDGVYSSAPMIPTLDEPQLDKPDDSARGLPSEITFKWHPIKEAIHYELHISWDNGYGSVFFRDDYIVDTFRIVKNIPTYTTLYWHVRAGKYTNYGKWSQGRQFTTVVGPAKLLSPENNSVDNPIFLDLVWEVSEGANNYQLQVAENENLDDPMELTLFSETTSTFSGAYNSVYYWRVKAANDDGESQWTDTWNFKTMYEIPILKAPTNGMKDMPLETTLSWDAVEGAEYYHLKVATDREMNNLVYEKADIDQAVKIIQDLDYETKYYWTVRAIYPDGESHWAEPFEFTTEEEPSSVVEEPVIGNFMSLNPNPAKSYFNINLQLENPSDVTVRVFNLLGREILPPLQSFVDSGSDNIEIKNISLPQGIYLVKLIGMGFEMSEKLIITK